ncbi:hypothetical protein [Lacipirellula parvula]|uniref:Transmembrane protein n=1 Tax=Lacipirellula parvula TaxID=2650471 RepID=A0A5K7XG77_9BACT|nr:hypothetical protein [Lacipirellula parvula]BBO33243.1 hypothetical protein PLANPX_2855 [Lacipirellula parvula]
MSSSDPSPQLDPPPAAVSTQSSGSLPQRGEAGWDEFHDIAIVNWKRIRTSIEHENLLVNHRITWLIASQAFLFAAFALIFQAAVVNDFLDGDAPSPEQDILVAAPSMGSKPPCRRTTTTSESVQAEADDIVIAKTKATAEAEAKARVEAEVEQRKLKRLRRHSFKVKCILAGISIVGLAMCIFISVSVNAAHRQIKVLEDWWDDHHSENDADDPATRFRREPSINDEPPINGRFQTRIFSVLSTKLLAAPIAFCWLIIFVVVFYQLLAHVQDFWKAIFGTLIFILGSVAIFKFLNSEPPKPAGREQRK